MLILTRLITLTQSIFLIIINAVFELWSIEIGSFSYNRLFSAKVFSMISNFFSIVGALKIQLVSKKLYFCKQNRG